MVHGDGSASRDYIYVDDVCSAIYEVLHTDAKKVSGEVFNVASGVHRSILSIAEDVTNLMSRNKSSITFVGERPGQVFRHTGNIKKIKNIIEWQPKISWEEGLRKTISWYKENRKWWEKQLWMRTVPIITKSGKKELH